jgi:hypothetical protein
MIIFIAGGVTYSEMRLAYTLGQSLGKDIYIGKYQGIYSRAKLTFRLHTYLDTREILQGYEIPGSGWYWSESTYCPS